MAIELDGGIHHQQLDYDAARTEQLNQFGFRVLRFRNEEVMTDLDRVLHQILEASGEPQSPPELDNLEG